MSERRRQLVDATVAAIARRGVRGLRVQEVAADAGVSVSLLYHYFGSREGLLTAALDAVSDNAERYAAAPYGSPREQLLARLLGEFQDDEMVRINSAAWGELRWASVFEASLRPQVARLTRDWVTEIAALIEQHSHAFGASDVGQGPDGVPDAGAQARSIGEILVALVEGLSNKWLAGAADADEVRGQLTLAVDLLVPVALE